MGDKRRRFDPEFREGAVRIVKETDKSVAQAARDLGITPYTLHNWMKADRERKAAGWASPSRWAGSGARSTTHRPRRSTPR